MKILIIGASSKASIGFGVGTFLRKKFNHEVLYASRSGKFGYKVDVTNPQQISLLLKQCSPEVIIYSAGVYVPPKNIGVITDWDGIKDHVLAKTIGPLMILNESIKSGSVKLIIAIGGTSVSANPGFGVFTVGNGALWSLVQFANRHSAVATYYIDLPLIKNSSMFYKYLKESSVSGKNKLMRNATDINTVSLIIEKVIENKYKSSRRIYIRNRKLSNNI